MYKHTHGKYKCRGVYRILIYLGHKLILPLQVDFFAPLAFTGALRNSLGALMKIMVNYR